MLASFGPDLKACLASNLALEIFEDFDRFFDHRAEFGADADAPQRIDEIIQAVDLLSSSPLIGRKAKGGNRELVIGLPRMGHVALCNFVPAIDKAFVLAFRSKREAGYKRDGYGKRHPVTPKARNSAL